MLKRAYNLLSSDARKKSIGQVFFVFILSLLNFAGLASLFPLMKVALDQGSDRVYILAVMGVVLAFIVVKNLLVTLINRTQVRFFLSQYTYFSNKLFCSYYRKGLSFIKENGPVRLANDVNSLCLMFSFGVLQSMFSIAGEAVLALMIFVALFVLSVKITVMILLVTLPLVFLYAIIVRKRLRLCGEEEIQARRKQARVTFETFRGYSELEVYSAFAKQLETFGTGLDVIGKCRERLAVMRPLPSFLSEFALVLGLVFLLISQEDHQLLVGGAFALAAFRLMPAFRSIVGAWSTIQQTSYCMDELEKDLSNQYACDASYKKIAFRDCLKAERLSFSFSDGTSVLNEFDMVIRKGERVGICGPSGAGKSTLFNLLLGFYQPTSGCVTIDGMRLDEETHRGWLDLVGYVPQDVFVMQDTLARNVAIGEDHIDENRLAEALRLACLSSWVESLPQGADTLLGEAGSRMSGGQRQRIGIARALYKGAEVLFLDEATSSVDMETEREINQTIGSLSDNCKELTIVVIAHRESSLSFCSRIVNVKK